jgi:hypothetical protein
MSCFIWLVLGAAVLVVGAVGLTQAGSMRWAKVTRPLMARLTAGQLPPRSAHYNVAELVGLPEPVQRYFRAVLTNGQPIITQASIEMTGSFNLSATDDQWRTFTSHHHVITHRPGFLWDARIAMLPGLTVHVVDSYVDGSGFLKASILGWVTLADMQGGGDIAHGEFMRYLAEAVWYPTALLPSQGVRWQAVDRRSANATLTDGDLALSLLFGFDEAGLIDSFHAEARGSMVGKLMVRAPWEGRFSNYQTRNGMLIPLSGEVAWLRPEGRKTYFKGVVTHLDVVVVSPAPC